MDTRPHANATIIRFALQKLFNIWRSASEQGHTRSCKAVYSLLLLLGRRFESSEQFMSELDEHIIPEAEKFARKGVDAGAVSTPRALPFLQVFD